MVVELVFEVGRGAGGECLVVVGTAVVEADEVWVVMQLTAGETGLVKKAILWLEMLLCSQSALWSSSAEEAMA